MDASNLERNLYLTLQLLELGIPCIVALNMLDIAEKQKLRIDVDALATRLGCPVVPLVSTRARGIDALKMTIDRHVSNQDVELVHYAQPLLREAGQLAQEMDKSMPEKQRLWLGLQMLEGDIYSRAYAGDAADKLDVALARLSGELDDPALHIADARYQTIAAICDVVSNALTAEPSRFTAAVDKVVLNRFLGLPIFLLVMCNGINVNNPLTRLRAAVAGGIFRDSTEAVLALRQWGIKVDGPASASHHRAADRIRFNRFRI